MAAEAMMLDQIRRSIGNALKSGHASRLSDPQGPLDQVDFLRSEAAAAAPEYRDVFAGGLQGTDNLPLLLSSKDTQKFSPEHACFALAVVELGAEHLDARLRERCLKEICLWRRPEVPSYVITVGLWALSRFKLAPPRENLGMYTEAASRNLRVLVASLPDPHEDLASLAFASTYLLDRLEARLTCEPLLQEQCGRHQGVEDAFQNSWPLLLLRLCLCPSLSSARLALCRFPYAPRLDPSGKAEAPTTLLDSLFPIFVGLGRRGVPFSMAAARLVGTPASQHSQLAPLVGVLTSSNPETACAGVCIVALIASTAKSELFVPETSSSSSSSSSAAASASPSMAMLGHIEGFNEAAFAAVWHILTSTRGSAAGKPTAFDTLLLVLGAANAHPHPSVRRAYHKGMRHIVDLVHDFFAEAAFNTTPVAVLTMFSKWSLLPLPALEEEGACKGSAMGEGEGESEGEGSGACRAAGLYDPNPFVLAECLATWLYSRRFLCSPEQRCGGMLLELSAFARRCAGALREECAAAAAAATAAAATAAAAKTGGGGGGGGGGGAFVAPASAPSPPSPSPPALLLCALLRCLLCTTESRALHVKSLAGEPSNWEAGENTGFAGLFSPSELRERPASAAAALAFVRELRGQLEAIGSGGGSGSGSGPLHAVQSLVELAKHMEGTLSALRSS